MVGTLPDSMVTCSGTAEADRPAAQQVWHAGICSESPNRVRRCIHASSIATCKSAAATPCYPRPTASSWRAASQLQHAAICSKSIKSEWTLQLHIHASSIHISCTLYAAVRATAKGYRFSLWILSIYTPCHCGQPK